MVRAISDDCQKLLLSEGLGAPALTGKKFKPRQRERLDQRTSNPTHDTMGIGECDVVQ
jgi:hypothetical protein